jgi:hypothetical protein
MANYVKTTLIQEGPSAFTVHAFIKSDGVTGELVNVPIVAASELTGLSPSMFLSMWELWYTVTNFTVQFSWKTLTTPVPAWCAAPGVDSRQKFHRFGGLIDPSGMYGQAQLLMTTQGFTLPSSYGAFVLRGRKHDGTPSAYKVVGVPQGRLAGTTILGA